MVEDKKIYNRIKVILAVRRARNKDLADHLNVSQQTVSKWVTNHSQPSIPELYKIAKFLNVEISELLEPLNSSAQSTFLQQK